MFINMYGPRGLPEYLRKLITDFNIARNGVKKGPFFAYIFSPIKLELIIFIIAQVLST
jgi:hypothetical protein